ncbi:phosphoserine transaminase [Hirschia maritima]|uniref:phosphoserine transaminase n=1 Tax=Hirschia maritima TaxID=1121961 RepID=UPI000360E27D|nr:phosphoserine transaminase [Hirschia maritima]
MTMITTPDVRPARAEFSSGPCAKRPDWTPASLEDAPNGRSHRAKIGKAKLKLTIDKSAELLGLPEGYRLGIMAGSDTGAIEAAMWSMLGPRPVDVFAWESFGNDWVTDVTKQLKLDAEVHTADYGQLPDLTKVRKEADVIFTWNGTTSGVKVANADWIPDDQEGLVFCDATSAVFAQDLEWKKLDVVTYSWQKVLGGEGAHGILILSPKAVERLETFTPDRPLPKLFRMTKKGKLNEGIFQGATINTPSMLAVEDCLDALNWVEGLGGVKATMARADANLAAIEKFVAGSDWADFLCEDPATRSNTSVTLKITDARVAGLETADQQAFVKKLTGLLDKEDVAYDIAGYRDAPPGLRIWCGATVDASDLEKLGPWLDWAFQTAVAEL